MSEFGPPQSAPTVRFSTRAMACEFAVVLNRGGEEFADPASLSLERVHTLEECMTAYRDDSELVTLNRSGGDKDVSEDLASVIRRALELFEQTEGRFDPTASPLIALWRMCRDEERIPTDDEIQLTLARVGGKHVRLNGRTVQLDQNVQLNLGAIGKGFALDEAGRLMESHGARDWLLHGGRSSILASGDHNQQGGWPVGIGNPVFTNKRLGVLVLNNEALGTSGSNIQYFRHGGKRYGHILDPRTGWPASAVASVTVLAPTAAEADALSTAFFVGGVEFAQLYCDNRRQVSAILIPFPKAGTVVEPVLVNMPADRVSWSQDQVKLSS